MSILQDCLGTVHLGAPQHYENLSVYPVLGDGPGEPDYQLLDAALGAGTARVTEISEAGSVPELRFVNDGDRSVLLVDGEELTGAKQNRILNLSVLAPPRQTLTIPVSCVEAGRWRHTSADFASAKRTHFAEARARKARRVSESLRGTGSRRSDQSEVWFDIEAKMARLNAMSDTGASDAMYRTHRVHIDEYLNAFAPVDRQLGALFAINGKATGLELFDSPASLAALLPKLVESNALDAIDVLMHDPASTAEPDPAALLSTVAAAATDTFPGVGEGEDHRIDSPDLAGGALVKDGRVVHLCAFRLARDPDDSPGMWRARMLRASQRRRRSE